MPSFTVQFGLPWQLGKDAGVNRAVHDWKVYVLTPQGDSHQLCCHETYTL